MNTTTARIMKHDDAREEVVPSVVEVRGGGPVMVS